MVPAIVMYVFFMWILASPLPRGGLHFPPQRVRTIVATRTPGGAQSSHLHPGKRGRDAACLASGGHHSTKRSHCYKEGGNWRPYLAFLAMRRPLKSRSTGNQQSRDPDPAHPHPGEDRRSPLRSSNPYNRSFCQSGPDPGSRIPEIRARTFDFYPMTPVSGNTPSNGPKKMALPSSPGPAIDSPYGRGGGGLHGAPTAVRSDPVSCS